jgi:hypothetical protein
MWCIDLAYLRDVDVLRIGGTKQVKVLSYIKPRPRVRTPKARREPGWNVCQLLSQGAARAPFLFAPGMCSRHSGLTSRTAAPSIHNAGDSYGAASVAPFSQMCSRHCASTTTVGARRSENPSDSLRPAAQPAFRFCPVHSLTALWFEGAEPRA